MMEAIVLVPGVPAVLLVLLLVLGRFEAVVAPEAEFDDAQEPDPAAALDPAGAGEGEAEAAGEMVGVPVGEDAEHSRAA